MFAQRREQLLAQMSENSAAVFFAAQEKTRSRDTEYSFRQDSDFYYFTGFTEPDACLILIKTATDQRSVIFNRAKDKLQEIWHGFRLGQEAAPKALGLDLSIAFEDIEQHLHLQLDGLDKVYTAQGRYPDCDVHLNSAIDKLRNGLRQGWNAPAQTEDWRPLVDEMRLVKSAAEIELMAQAGEISAQGHIRAMRDCKPGMLEFQLEANILHEFSKQGARFASYNTIVGGGANACCLHYTENNCLLESGDLVLIDAGAEYQYYAGDITRTLPVNGKFSPEQAKLYQIVLNAEEAAIAMLKPGVSIAQANRVALEIMVTGMVELGIMHGDVDMLIEEEAYKEFYMHGLGHWIGIDVHDVGDYQDAKRTRPLQAGNVITIEPGLYIASDANVPAAYQGMGIRIEDDILITQDGHRNLTASAPKSIADIETLMARV
ncbi:Xaa-Pro aminopeptidase [Alginatibacterium sediminis]|uniref:Xaa-Pro aminopeptidase n=1 Tax=Alginatibacterium sediminis TaxID=2164068 RepID=A0A420EDC8_9ALTE|nr:Xaa-Pro aminopeptidase [Alginatibacterium sediminis]RKF18671.1 Xaa-Pro aminopeptidase [Alginatibacterium sediminis]